jgi:cytosine/uracil/thiamine/allantoin permease
MTLRQVDLFWVANSVNLFSFAIGALAIAQGLSRWMALAACFPQLDFSALKMAINAALARSMTCAN